MAMTNTATATHPSQGKAQSLAWTMPPGWWILPAVFGGIYLWYLLIAALIG